METLLYKKFSLENKLNKVQCNTSCVDSSVKTSWPDNRNILFTFCIRHSKRNVYWLRPSVCVCLPLHACVHYYTYPDVTMRNGRGCPLLVQYLKYLAIGCTRFMASLLFKYWCVVSSNWTLGFSMSRTIVWCRARVKIIFTNAPGRPPLKFFRYFNKQEIKEFW